MLYELKKSAKLLVFVLIAEIICGSLVSVYADEITDPLSEDEIAETMESDGEGADAELAYASENEINTEDGTTEESGNEADYEIGQIETAEISDEIKRDDSADRIGDYTYEGHTFSYGYGLTGMAIIGLADGDKASGDLSLPDTIMIRKTFISLPSHPPDGLR